MEKKQHFNENNRQINDESNYIGDQVEKLTTNEIKQGQDASLSLEINS